MTLERRILIVDDDQQLLRVIKLILSLEGFTVETASSGSLGLGCIETASFDLILLDLQMPEMDGRTFFREIRARGCQSRVVLVSAHGAEVANLELQADGFVAKPFDPDLLLRKIQDVLAR